jgi:pre-mRNA-processing factor 6
MIYDNSVEKSAIMKSIVLERQLGNLDAVEELLSKAVELFPGFDKLWMIKGQIEADEWNNSFAARETYAKALKSCPNSSTLWILAAKLEEKAGLLEKAPYTYPKKPELWYEAIRLEMGAKNESSAKTLLAKALQECPTSGILWSEAIFLERRSQPKAKSTDALRKCDHDVNVVLNLW